MTLPLASVDDLILRINAIDAQGLRPLLYESLKSATIQLKDIFRLGELDAGVAVIEDFLIDRDTAVRGERYLKFRVTNAFIDETTNSVDVLFGITEDDLVNATSIDPKFLKINTDKGTVKFDVTGFNSDLITISRRIPDFFFEYLFRITYDHGFANISTEDGRIYDGVPEWLKEAGLIKAREIYQLTNPSKDVPADAFSGNLAYLVDNNIRVAPLHLDPIDQF